MILADYDCPSCGVFEETVPSPAPDDILCPECNAPCTWVPTPVMGRVKKFEVVRGGWQKPERKTWLDTRELGEGMPLDEWREKRRKIREEQRRKELKELMS